MIPTGSRLRGALLALGVAVATAVAACGGGGGGSTTGGPVGLSSYNPVKGTQGGQLTYSDWESVADLNQLSSTAQTTTQATTIIWAWLWQFGPDGKPIADLASEVPTTANGDVKQIDAAHMDVTIKLKSGLKWSDGSPLTTADLHYTLNTICDPASGAATQVGYDHIASIEDKSSTEEVWHFGPDTTGKRCGGAAPADTGVYAPFLLLTFQPLPKAALSSVSDANLATSDYFTKLPTPTSGPYEVQSFTPGAAAVVSMVPNPHYADGRGGALVWNHKPYLDKLTYKIYGNKQAQIAGLASGDTDLGFDLIAKDFPTLPSTNDNTYAYGGEMEYLNYNEGNNTTGCDAQKFAATCGTAQVWKDDPKLRDALDKAVDRDTMITSLVQGIGKKFNGAILPGYQFYDASTNPTPSFDIAGANSALDADGWTKGADGIRTKNGRKLAFTISTTAGNPQRAAEAEQIISNWAKVGAQVTLKTFEAAVFFNDFKGGGTNATGQFDVSMYANTFAPIDPDAFCSGIFESSQIPTAANPSGQNWDRINDPLFDSSCAAGVKTTDPTKRASAYHDLQTEFHKYVPFSVLYIRPDVFSHSKNFGNFAPMVNTCLAVCNSVDWFRKSS